MQGLMKGKQPELSVSYKENPENLAVTPFRDRGGIEPANIGPNWSFCAQPLSWVGPPYSYTYRSADKTIKLILTFF